MDVQATCDECGCAADIDDGDFCCKDCYQDLRFELTAAQQEIESLENEVDDLRAQIDNLALDQY